MPESYEMKISQAKFPMPFPMKLEYSSPARGVWNISHTGMLIPEAHQIFVCAKGCLRGVALTAAEMGAMGRYSALEIHEKHVIHGLFDGMMVDGVADIISKLPYRPKAILIYINCQHFFLTYDKRFVFKALKERFPDIDFTECYMIPTLRKSGMAPAKKMKIQLYSLLKKAEEDPRQITLIGNDHKIDESCEIYRLLSSKGYFLRSIQDCRTYAEYQNLAKAHLNIVCEPSAVAAAKELEKRLGIPYIYLPNVFESSKIEENYRALMSALGEEYDASDTIDERKKAEEQLLTTAEKLKNVRIALDYTFTPRILSLVGMLLKNGFELTDIYTDTFLPEEKEEYEWLCKEYPNLSIHPTISPEMRFYKNEDGQRTVALGQKSAYFERTDRFVNISDSCGIFGFAGLRKLAELLADAMENPKELEKEISKKASGLMNILNQEKGSFSLVSGPENKLLDKNYSNASREPEKAAAFCCSGMSESSAIIPTYSSDEFGAASVLFDMSGLVVIHDASGCNSTYTTHDEPRWFNTDSMFYISALSEREAIMGDDNKFLKDLEDAVKIKKPAFIALLGAPIPYMSGVDLKALARLIEGRTGIPAIGVDSNGMNGYSLGIELALSEMIKKFTCTAETKMTRTDEKLRINFIGATPLDFPVRTESIDNWADRNGFIINSRLGMNGGVEAFENAENADVNLVLTSGGIEPAKLLLEMCGIPFICGIPYGNAYSRELAGKIKGKNSLKSREPRTEDTFVVIGETISALSLKHAIESETGINVICICAEGSKEPVDNKSGDVFADCEDAVAAALQKIKNIKAVIADPYYKLICSKDTAFIDLPHRGFSGRIFENSMYDLCGNDWNDFIGKVKEVSEC